MTNGVAFSALADGSVVYESTVTLISRYYTVDPENPLRFIPSVPPCTARRIKLRVLECKRTRADWRCGLTNKPVSPKDCQECDHATQ